MNRFHDTVCCGQNFQSVDTDGNSIRTWKYFSIYKAEFHNDVYSVTFQVDLKPGEELTNIGSTEIYFVVDNSVRININLFLFSEWAECSPPCIERRACEYSNRITQTRSQCRRCNKGKSPVQLWFFFLLRNHLFSWQQRHNIWSIVPN